MDVFSIVVYGIIQGLTEFLPVSSSAHLALLPHVLKISDPGVEVDLMMHLGTALAVTVYFRQRIMNYMKLLPSFFKLTSVFISQIKKRPSDQLTPVSEQEGKELFFLINMITATVGSLIFIFIFKNLAFRYGRSAYLIAFNSIFFGILMIIADRWGKNSLENTDMMEKDVQPKLALLIGFFQSIAIFPGVSRSGATLSISRMMGLSREEAAHFSFLLSLPIIFAGCIAKGIDFVTQMLFYPQMVVAKNLLVLVLGIVISFVVGYFTIHYFLKLIKKIGLIYFSYYRFALGIIILIYFSYH